MLKIGKNTLFIYLYFLNMEISLIMNISGMETAIHVAKTRLKGRVSQNFDEDLSFYFISCRRLNFKKNTNNHKSYPFFALKHKLVPE